MEIRVVKSNQNQSFPNSYACQEPVSTKNIDIVELLNIWLQSMYNILAMQSWMDISSPI